MEKRTCSVLMIAFVIVAMLGGCSGKKEQSALYILEELETASAV